MGQNQSCCGERPIEVYRDHSDTADSFVFEMTHDGRETSRSRRLVSSILRYQNEKELARELDVFDYSDIVDLLQQHSPQNRKRSTMTTGSESGNNGKAPSLGINGKKQETTSVDVRGLKNDNGNNNDSIISIDVNVASMDGASVPETVILEEDNDGNSGWTTPASIRSQANSAASTPAATPVSKAKMPAGGLFARVNTNAGQTVEPPPLTFPNEGRLSPKSGPGSPLRPTLDRILHLPLPGITLPQFVQSNMSDTDFLGSPVHKKGREANCWAKTDSATFKVRGKSYLKDKKKIPSDDFMYNVSTCDLYSTTQPRYRMDKMMNLSGIVRSSTGGVPHTLLFNGASPCYPPSVWAAIPEDQRKGHQLVIMAELSDEAKMRLNGDLPLTPALRLLQKVCLQAASKDKKVSDLSGKKLKMIPMLAEPQVALKLFDSVMSVLVKSADKTPIKIGEYNDTKISIENHLLLMEFSAHNFGWLAKKNTWDLQPVVSQVVCDLALTFEGNKEDELPECLLLGARFYKLNNNFETQPILAPPLAPEASAGK